MEQVKLAVVGVGLIGGSIARRLRFSGLAKEVLGVGRNPERLQKAKELGIIDSFATDYSALADSQVVFLATPIDHIISHLPQVLSSVSPGALIMDVGSVKGPIYRRYLELRDAHPQVWFIPAHPIAGSHLTGFEHSRKDLFFSRPAVICPVEGVPEDVLEMAELVFNFLGMDVYRLSAEEHDRILAYTSHLPHLISFSYRDVVKDEMVRFSAGAFRDLTRIANADIHLWNGIFRHNRQWVEEAGDAFLEAFGEKLSAIKEGREVVVSYLPYREGDCVYTVAIDGPAGAGKSTIAKLLAVRLGFRLIDTGAMYRAGTLACMRKEVDLEDVDAVVECVKASSIELTEDVPPRVLLNGEDVSEEIRVPEVTKNVVYLAREPEVRRHFVAIQREMALQGKAVIEGRDVTTEVIPEARFKFYLDASFEERVKRRFNDLRHRKIEIALEVLRRDMLLRDASDLRRSMGPLRKARDAFYVDSTHLSIEHTLNIIYYEIKRRMVNEDIQF